jgi:hypothetical protein
MDKKAVLIFILALFGSFILLAFNVSRDEKSVDVSPNYSKIETAISHVENKKEIALIPKIVIAKQEEEKVIEETKTVGAKEIVYVPEIVKVEVPIYIPPLQAISPVKEIVKEPIIENIMEYTLEIISPMAGKGLGREYLSRDSVKDEFNYLEIALIVWEGEEAKKDSLVKVVCTDSSQNKEINGTGFIANIYKDGIKQKVHAYFFHYEFKEAGNHTITFFAEGKEKTTETLVVTVDERE